MSAVSVNGRHRRLHTTLPAPPSGEELYIYSERGQLYVATLQIIGFISFLATQIFFEVRAPFGWLLSPLTALYASYQIANMCVNLPGHGFDFTKHAKQAAAWCPPRWPTVDIFLPICGESREVLVNTWQAVADLIRAYPGHARGYVLDDGADASLHLIAAAHGLDYLCRPYPGKHKKSGNIRWAFNRTSGEHIVIFDADFAPSPRFLSETLPYMNDRATGIVQTPQYFRSQPAQAWVERAAGTVQEIFYRFIQVSRDRLGSALCVGTNAVYRRAALDPDGGFTLIAYAEDSHTGLDTLWRGYRIRYVPVILAAGLCPSTLASFVRQQYRWSCGSISMIFTNHMWRVPMPWRSRIPFINGFLWNVWTAINSIIGPAVPILVLLFDPGIVKPRNFVILVPALAAGLITYPLWHTTGYGPSAWPIRIATGWAQALALWDYARGNVMSWQSVGSSTSSVRRFRVGVYWNALLALTWLALIAWRTIQYRNETFIVVAGFGLYYAALVACVLVTDWKEAR